MLPHLKERCRARKPSVLAHALSGVVGALLAEVLLFPVDTIKLQMQTAGAGDTVGSFGMLLRVVKRAGIGGLYKGLRTSVVKEGIHSFNYWIWHDTVFRVLSLHGDTSRTPMSKRLVLNLISKWLNWFCTVPFEVISSVNQLAVDNPGFVLTAVRLYRQGGIANFYRGLFLSLVLAVNPAIMNTLITTELRLFALVKMSFLGQDYQTARDHSPGTTGMATGLAKFVATVLTYPLIRAKILQQTDKVCAQSNPLQIWRRILAAEGFRGLYRGMLAMTYKTVLWNGLMMTFKTSLGPKRVVTPPSTPPCEQQVSWVGREPVADFMNSEKLNEILSYLRTMNIGSPTNERVELLERRLDSLSGDISEIKSSLRQLAAAHK